MSYDPFAKTFSESRKNHPWPELTAIIADMQKTGIISILDIGCGNGRFLEEAEKLGYPVGKYLGTDNSASMIEEAQKLHTGYNFEVCDMTDIGTIMEKGSFDAILFLASFHHLTTREERITTLREVGKFLTPGGKIYMTNWNLLEQSRYTDSHLGNGDFAIKIGEYSRYYHGFTLEELTELFDETGYRILDHRVFDGGRNIYSVLTYAHSEDTLNSGFYEVDLEAIQKEIAYYQNKNIRTYILSKEIHTVEDIFIDIRNTLPLNSPLQKNSGWDALEDSLWSGIDDLETPEILIVWKSAKNLNTINPEAYTLMKSIFSDMCETLSGNELTEDRPTHLTVLALR